MQYLFREALDVGICGDVPSEDRLEAASTIVFEYFYTVYVGLELNVHVDPLYYVDLSKIDKSRTYLSTILLSYSYGMTY